MDVKRGGGGQGSCYRTLREGEGVKGVASGR